MKTGRVVIGIILGLASLVLCVHFANYKVGVVFAASMIAAGLFDFNIEIEKHPAKGIYCGGFLLAASFAEAYLSQFMLNESILLIGPLRIALEMAICLVIIFVILLITLRLRLSVCLGAFLIQMITLVNYVVYSCRGSEFKPADILAAGTAANVAVEYHLQVDSPMLYSWIMFILLVFVCTGLPYIKLQRLKGRAAAAVIGMILTLFVCVGTREIGAWSFLNSGASRNGYLVNFMALVWESFISPPKGYSPDHITAQETEYPLRQGEKDGPDIIAIMDESFADFRVLGNELQVNQQVTPFIDSLHENTIRGYALSSVYGGGTATSEYEFLSGNSQYFMPEGSTAYCQYISTPAYSVVSELKNRGYRCLAMHPYLKNGWERERIYPLFGFDGSYFLDDYPQENMIRNYVSDQESFEKIIQLYEENKEESNQNLFLFNVTMQNHGPYDYDGENFEYSILLEGYTQEYQDAQQYLSLIHETDRAVEYLIRYFEKVENDVVVVFFGDHFPRLNDSFYEEIHGETFSEGEEEGLKYRIPFFVWANYDIEEAEIELTGIPYLTNYMYQAAGMELPPYNQFLARLQGIFPAIHADGYYTEGLTGYHLKKNTTVMPEDLKLYHEFVYNCIFDEEERNTYFFPVITE